VIEVVSGMSLLEFEKKRLFDPLGMTETSYRVLDPATQQRLAELLPGENFGGAFPRNPRLPRRWESGAGGLASTVFDYARFCRMILGGGELDGRRYLRPGTFGAMVSDRLPPHVLPGDHYFPGDGFGFGLGFAVRISRGQHNAPGAIGELKWDGALGTYFWIDPKEDMFVILMMQTTKHAERIKPLLKKAVYDAFGK
jgi:CubicO group peptidase (beta-lactamase class C family)